MRLIASQLGIEKVSLDEVPTSAGDPDRSVGMQGAFSVKQVRKKWQEANVALLWQGGKAMLKVTFKSNKSSPLSIPIRIGGEVTAGRHDSEVVLAQPRPGSTSAKDRYEFKSEQQQEGLKLRQQLGQVLEMMELKRLIAREMRDRERSVDSNGLRCSGDLARIPSRKRPRSKEKDGDGSAATSKRPVDTAIADSRARRWVTARDLKDPVKMTKRLQAEMCKARARPAARVDLFDDQARSTRRRSKVLGVQRQPISKLRPKPV